MIAALLFAAILPSSCAGGDVAWERFNSTEDALVIQVTQSGTEGGERVLVLHSNTGLVEVGDASVAPGSGPVGTVHRLVVRVDEPWDVRVARVALSIDSGARGETQFELTQDSATAGVWTLDVTSAGVVGEERDDLWSIGLYEAPAPDTGG